MSLYVMVSADFPGVTDEQRKVIYDCLSKDKWTNIHTHGRDISTVWKASFKDGVTNDEAISTAKSDFEKCSKPYTTPKLAIHAGPNGPKVY